MKKLRNTVMAFKMLLYIYIYHLIVVYFIDYKIPVSHLLYATIQLFVECISICWMHDMLNFLLNATIQLFVDYLLNAFVECSCCCICWTKAMTNTRKIYRLTTNAIEYNIYLLLIIYTVLTSSLFLSHHSYRAGTY